MLKSIKTITVFEAPETPLYIAPDVVTPDASEQPNGIKKIYMQDDGDDSPDERKLIEETQFKLGKMEGMQYKWHPNGTLAYAGKFSAGKEVGVHYVYYDNGNKFTEKTYEDGVLNGPARQWYYDGKVHKDGEFKNGKIHGMYFEYSGSGAILVACIFDEGVMIRRAF